MKIPCSILVAFFFSYTLLAQESEIASNSVFRIKLKPDYINKLEKSFASKSLSSELRTGVTTLDALNKESNVISMRPLFATGGKYEKRRREFGLHLWYEVQISPEAAANVKDILGAYKKEVSLSMVEPVYKKTHYKIKGQAYGPLVVEPNNVTGLRSTFNDPGIDEQWHYNNTGQTAGLEDADIDLFEAWDITTGSNEVIVSIHDGGIDYDHEDLADNMWVNEAELNGSAGVDDDGNGYIDDIYGYNFVFNEGNVIPDVDGHGTHVAGTVAAVNDNGIGVAGVAGGGNGGSGISLMSCQVFVSGGGGFAESYAYAADNGAIISQNSWGYLSPGFYEQSVLDAIDYFIANAGYDASGNPVGPMQGGLVIFAAGNSDSNSDYYPGFYEPTLAVASTNHEDQKAWYSNYGTWVDISAPGGETSIETEGVLSTLPNNSYGFFQGTSMACPHVSGVAALIVSQYGGSGLTPNQVRFRLTETTDDIEALNPSYSGELGSGRMNAFASLLTDDGIPPDAILDLSAVETRHDQITLGWTAPIDEDNVSASSYEIRMSNAPINDDNFNSAQLIFAKPAQVAGSTEEHIVTGLSAVTTYYFAIKSFDFFSNSSEVSNSLEAATSNPPVIDVSPLSLNESLYTGEYSTQFVTISNTGEGVLEYTLAVSPQGFTPSKTIISASPKFEGLDIPYEKNFVVKTDKIYQKTSFAHSAKPSNELMSADELSEILDNLNESYTEITDLIPNSYFFSGGESGSSIGDGGSDMYDGGNRMGTNLGSDISYTGSTVLTSTAFGSESYFTAKYPGLFILSADINDLDYFEITGNLGADGSGSMDAAVLNVSKGARNYLGFVKRVYDAFDPSVNHLIIVEDNGSVNHEFSTNTDNDYHRIFNLENISRVHYLLYASANGGYIDNATTLEIMSAYLEIVDATSGVVLEEITGTVAEGLSNEIPITFDARGIDQGQYLNNIVISSNDVATGDVTVMTELNVEGAPNIVTNVESIDLGNVFIDIEQDTAFYIINNGSEQLEISNISSSNSDLTVDITTASILPSDSVYIPINYAISSLGSFEIVLSIASNDSNEPTVTILLSGRGLEPPVISVNPTSISENLNTGEEATHTLNISNTGGSDLIIEASAFGFGVESGPHEVFDWFVNNEGWNFELQSITDDPSSSTIIDNQADFHIDGNSYLHPWGTGLLRLETDEFNSSPVPLEGYSTGESCSVGDIFSMITRNGEYAKIRIDEIKSSSIVFTQIFPVEPLETGSGVNVTFIKSDYHEGLNEAQKTADVNVTRNWIDTDTDQIIIAPGESVEKPVFLDASGLVGGVYESSISISSNDPITPLLEVPVTLNVTGAPDILVSSSEIQFNDHFVGTSVLDSVIIENIGTEILNISNISAPEGFEIEYDYSSLEIGKSQQLRIEFNPSEARSYTEDVIITSDDPNQPSLSISVTGQGVNPPVIVSSNNRLVESLIVNTSSQKTLTILNEGLGILDYSTRIRLTGKDNPNGGRKGQDLGFYADSSRYSEVRPDLGTSLSALGDTLNIASNFYMQTTGMTLIGDELYIVSWGTRELIVFNVNSEQEINRFPIHLDPYGIAFDGEYLWIGDYVGNVYGYTMQGEAIASFSMPFLQYPSLTWDGNVFLTNPIFTNNPVIYKVDNSGTILDEYNSDNLSGELYNIVSANTDGVYVGLDARTTYRIFTFELIDGQLQFLDLVPFSTRSFGYSLTHNGNDILYSSWDGNLLSVDDGIDQLGWLIIESPEGSITPNTSEELQLQFNSEELEDGTYYANLLISSNDPQTPLLTVDVELNVCSTAAESPVQLTQTIEDQEMIMGEGKLLMDLDAHFQASTDITYQALLDNGSLGIMEMNGPILSFEARELGQANVTLEAFDANCGKAVDEFAISVIEVTSLLDGIGAINMYPNPVDDRLILTGLEGQFNAIQILTIQGVILEEFKLSPDTNDFDISFANYANGIHLIVLIGETESQIARVAISH